MNKSESLSLRRTRRRWRRQSSTFSTTERVTIRACFALMLSPISACSRLAGGYFRSTKGRRFDLRSPPKLPGSRLKNWWIEIMASGATRRQQPDPNVSFFDARAADYEHEYADQTAGG